MLYNKAKCLQTRSESSCHDSHIGSFMIAFSVLLPALNMGEVWLFQPRRCRSGKSKGVHIWSSVITTGERDKPMFLMLNKMMPAFKGLSLVHNLMLREAAFGRIHGPYAGARIEIADNLIIKKNELEVED